jgi:hypothetical protein
MLFYVSLYSGVSVPNTYVSMNFICSRHDCEQELIKIRKQIEDLNKELAVNLKKIKTVEATLQTNQEEDENFQVC